MIRKLIKSFEVYQPQPSDVDDVKTKLVFSKEVSEKILLIFQGVRIPSLLF